jgi:hypothetical protein
MLVYLKPTARRDVTENCDLGIQCHENFKTHTREEVKLVYFG